MAARNETFPWTSHYGHYKYFETLINKHNKTASLTEESNGIYTLVRTQGDTLRIFICECYAFGTAETLETIEKLGEVNAIVINSIWCGYSPEAKQFCRDSVIGLFKIAEFMGALHRDDYWLYLTEAEEEYFQKKGWL